MTLDDALLALGDQGRHAVNPVVVTFDDGTRDFVDEAVPVLARYGIPATLYLSTAFVEHGEALPYGAPPVSWAGLRDAVSTGLITIGSHTHTHALLDRLPAHELAHELDEPSRLVEEQLQVTPMHFAYPKALPGSPAARSRGAREVPLGRVGRDPSEPLRRHRRVPVGPITGPGVGRHALVPREGGRRDGASRTTSGGSRTGSGTAPRRRESGRGVNRKRRIVHVTTSDISLALLLGSQLRAFVEAGYEVFGVSGPGPFAGTLAELGVQHEVVGSLTRAANPRADLRGAGRSLPVVPAAASRSRAHPQPEAGCLRSHRGPRGSASRRWSTPSTDSTRCPPTRGRSVRSCTASNGSRRPVPTPR